jgi:cytochrome c nitrite reductase small subunit
MNFIRRFLRFVQPPVGWKISVILMMGILVGLFFLLFHISRASSYLSDRPETCINCHVMYPQYASWTKGSHGHTATCNDCHVPQDNVVRQYFFKASDGMRHATYFTMRWEPQTIEIKPAGINVVQENCIRCHYNLIDMTTLVTTTGKSADAGQGKLCWDCHRETPHGTVRSLSAAPHSLVERLPSVLPDWLNRFMRRTENRQNIE